jgi:protein SCO1/2
MLFYLVGAMLLLGVLAVVVVSWANSSLSQLPVWGEVPEFEFVAASSGEPFGLEQMKGKVNIVDFIFTNCRGACPVMAVGFSELYTLYAGSDKVRFVSITVDPNRDSLEVLRAYAAEQGVYDDRWVFLRGPIEQVTDLCENGFMLPADGLPMGHTTKFIVVDHLGQIRSYHEGLEEASRPVITHNVKQLVRELP